MLPGPKHRQAEFFCLNSPEMKTLSAQHWETKCITVSSSPDVQFLLSLHKKGKVFLIHPEIPRTVPFLPLNKRYNFILYFCNRFSMSFQIFFEVVLESGNETTLMTQFFTYQKNGRQMWSVIIAYCVHRGNWNLGTILKK